MRKRATVRLFRAVSAAELRDIVRYGGFRQRPASGSMEAKLFATSLDDAAAFGRLLYRIDQEPFTIVEIRLPASFAAHLIRIEADSMQTVAVDGERLTEFSAVASVRVRSSVPIRGRVGGRR
jgi:hypothetical protein